MPAAATTQRRRSRYKPLRKPSPLLSDSSLFFFLLVFFLVLVESLFLPVLEPLLAESPSAESLPLESVSAESLSDESWLFLAPAEPERLEPGSLSDESLSLCARLPEPLREPLEESSEFSSPLFECDDELVPCPCPSVPVVLA
jgi:hypothetical protein